ncbi:hypothetical protein [Acidovorax sp.]|uniref:hypothetical protein n=1 Tax=Acidovorax sp. TaxID=1872122 RepID=UPI002ACEFE7A|nr:hypothetical protein [Acidovorax sp.]MDZ7862858.1 hypothetical protein [Acidovorax sp.]
MNRKKPLGRALKDFKQLSSGELQLLNACRKGNCATLGEGVPESATDAQRVRATFVRFLLLGGDEQAPVHERGVQLRGAFVEGSLDLHGCCIPANVSLSHCRFEGHIYAKDARVDGLFSLHGSHLARGLIADRFRCSAGVFLRSGFNAQGEVNLLGAVIGGNLDCSGGQFEVEDGDALSLDGADVKGAVSLSNGFKTTGKVRLLSAHVGGQLDCRGGLFEVSEGYALAADGIDVKGNVLMSDGFKAAGEVRLLGAQIGGNLDCREGQFLVGAGDAVSLDGAEVKRVVSLSNGFRATGLVRLLGVQIGGNLDCTGGRFEVPAANALSADRMNVRGSVSLRNGFKTTGEVRLLGAQIGGNLDCNGGLFLVETGNALLADGVDVKGDVALSYGFKATGAVRLLGAQIGGDLSCSGGQFEMKTGPALSTDRACVAGSVFLRDGFKATGMVRLPGVQIGNHLDCTDGEFDVLSLDSAVVRGAWLLYNCPRPVRINASHSDVAVLVDDLAAWADDSVLDGMRYMTLGGQAPTSGRERLAWLSKQPKKHFGGADGADFRPQPWRQVQRVLREMGHNEDAKQVGIAFEDHLRTMGRLGESPPGTHAMSAWLKRGVAHVAHYAFGKLAGYGYRPIRLVAWMAMVWFLCGATYWWIALPPRSAMAPSDPLVFQNASYAECLPDQVGQPGNWYLCGPLRGEYATFSPFAFSLDLMLPVVDLGQEKTWGAFVPTPKANPLEELFCHWHWGHAARLLTWFQTLFGWVSSLLLVAIVSGFSRRNDEGS